MAGINNGEQSHIWFLNELAKFVPCTVHNLNLVGVLATIVSSAMITFFGIIKDTYFFLQFH